MSEEVILPSVISELSMLVPRVAAMVIVSVVPSLVMAMPAPLARVRVSVVESATGLVPAGVDIVSNRFWEVLLSEAQAQAEPFHLIISLVLQLFWAMSAKSNVPSVISEVSMAVPRVEVSVTELPRATLPPPERPVPAVTVMAELTKLALAMVAEAMSLPVMVALAMRLEVMASAAMSAETMVPFTISLESISVPRLELSVTVTPRLTAPPPDRPVPAVMVTAELAS